MAQAAKRQPGVVRFATFEVDIVAGELRRNGRRLAVQDQPFQVLTILLEQPGELVTRDELHRRLWTGNSLVDFEHGLNAAINRLREALGDSARVPRFVETLPRRGYRFVGSVAGVSPRSHFQGASLAVLPLVNLTGDINQQYFADGLTEAFITALGKVSGLGVTSRTSIMQYKDVRRPLKEIARELEVDAVIEGSVFRVADHLHVAVQLIEASNDRHLWSENYVRNLEGVLSLQNDVVRAITRELNIPLTADESKRLSVQRSVRPDAYEAYLKARYHRAQFTGDGPKKALQWYQRAIAVDPQLAEAYAGEAEIYALHGFYRLSPRMSWPAAVSRAQAAAQRALELDETLAEAHAAQGLVSMSVWDWPTAERHYRRAIDLNPSSDVARQWYMQLLRQIGRVDEALAVIQLAARLNPLDLLSQTMLAWPHFHARRYEEAIEQFDRVLDLDPDYALAVYNRGLAYALSGRPKDAIAAARRAIPLMAGDAHATMLLCAGLAASGHRSKALESVRVLQRMIAHRDAEPFLLAWPYMLLHKEQQALDCLEQSFAARSPFLPNYTSEPICDGLRVHPRFQKLRVGMGLS